MAVMTDGLKVSPALPFAPCSRKQRRLRWVAQSGVLSWHFWCSRPAPRPWPPSGWSARALALGPQVNRFNIYLAAVGGV